MSTELVGKSFVFNFGRLAVKFTYVSQSKATFTILDGGGMAPDGHNETVEIGLTKIRDGLYLDSWTEASGDTVTQVEDHATSTVYANITSAGILHNLVGTITEL